MTAVAHQAKRYAPSSPKASGDRFLLITDRADRSTDLAGILSLAGEVSQVSATDLDRRHDDYFRMVVDVDLANLDTVMRLRHRLEESAARRVPRYFVVRGDRHHGTMQAQALGATTILSHPFEAEVLLADISADCAATFASELANSQEVVCVGVAAAHQIFVKIFAGLKPGRGLSLNDVLEQEETITNALRTSGLKSWLDVVNRHHSSTYRHCLSVTGFAVAFAQHLQFSASDQRRLARAALLHDIGKAHIPLSILDKPGRLTDIEMAEMRRHSQLGHDLLVQQGGFPHEALDVVLHHHELLDGSGYPDALSGNDISDLVRMVTIADIYSALVERRSYRPGMERAAAYAILEGMAGKLDPDLLKEFRRVALGN